MSDRRPKFYDGYDADRPLLARCACGGDHAPADHQAPRNPGSAGEFSQAFIEASIIKALFPHEPLRRAFLKAVGRNAAMAAIASVVPIASLQALAQEARGGLEKKDLKIGFISITCASPLIMAEPLGHYSAQGLKVRLVKTPGWGVIRDRVMNKEHDASHFLSPMPIAMTLGLGSEPFPTSVATIQNNNGQAITLSVKHKNRRHPKLWKGFSLGVPFVFSMHNLLLRYYLADFGVDPDADVKIVAVPPPEMVAKLRDGAIDGFLGPDPYNQRAVFDGVGFIHILSKEIWDGHPCCSFAAPTAFVKEAPNSFAALFRAVLKGAALARDPANRKTIAESIAPANYLNQPVAVLEQVLTGKYADGLGNVKTDPNRVDFDPFPWYSMATWILS